MGLDGDVEELSSRLEDPMVPSFDFSKALGRLRSQLLDLTAQNRLLNFRYTRRSLRFVGTSLNASYESLLKGESIQLRYVPLPDEKDGVYPVAKDYAAQLGLPTSYELEPSGDVASSHLQTIIYPKDLERVLRILHADNRLATEESGNHILFLVCGFLNYTLSDVPDSSAYVAPLLMLPVLLYRGEVDITSGLYTYHMKSLDEEEEVRDNITLREKLSREFGFQLPMYDEYPNPSSYLQALADACGNRKGWKVLPHLSLTLLSFKKIALWADLDLHQDPTLIQHPLIKKLFGAEAEGASNEGIAEEYAVDEHPLAELPLIYDVDSSQHSALIDALEGKNLVIVGPPGTGKSQTITNLIAVAMGRGKSVLFISDKKAALDVVSKRIESAGLGAFCLELHSNRSCKKTILQSLERRLNQIFQIGQTTSELHSLREMRRRLNSYATLMNWVVDIPGSPTIHDMLWKVEQSRQALGLAADRLQNLCWPDTLSWTAEDLHVRRGVIVDLLLHYNTLTHKASHHPLQGMAILSYSPMERLKIEEILRNGSLAIAGLLDTDSIIWRNSQDGVVSIADWNVWLEKLKEISDPEGSDILYPKDSTESIIRASSREIRDMLTLIRALLPNLRESNKLHTLQGNIPDNIPLTQSPIDDMSIARLMDIRHYLVSVLTLGGVLLPSSSLTDLEKLIAWLHYGERRRFLSSSLDEVHSVLSSSSILNQKDYAPELGGYHQHKQLDCIELKTIAQEAEGLIDELTRGLRLLGPLQEGLCLKEMNATTLDILQVYSEIFESVPMNNRFIQSSYTGLSEDIIELEDLVKEQNELMVSFQFEALPDSSELQDYLNTLLGASWWSSFYRRVRRAKKRCGDLFRPNIPADVFYKALNQLLSWCKRRDKFLSCPLKAKRFERCLIVGSQDRTDLEDLLLWLNSSLHRFKDKQFAHDIALVLISQDTVQYLRTNKENIQNLIRVRSRLHHLLSILNPHLRELESLSELASTITSGSVTFKDLETAFHCLKKCTAELSMLGRSVACTTSLSDLRDLASAYLREIELVLDCCQNLAPSCMTPRQILAAMHAHQRVMDLTRSLRENKLLTLWSFSLECLDVKRLEKIEKTLLWLLEVKEIDLPPALERKLLTQPIKLGCIRDVLQQQLAYTRQWREVAGSLQQFGISDPALWSFSEKGFSIHEVQATKDRFDRVLNSLDDMMIWIAYNKLRESGISLGLSEIIQGLESDLFAAENLVDAFDYVYHRSCMHSLYKQFPDLSCVVGSTLDGMRQAFAELDSKIVRLNGGKLAVDIARRIVPEGRKAAKASEQTELMLLKHEIAKTRRHLPIRTLMKQAGCAIQALKPCFLMSPLAVAQYLPRTALTFDLLIIDEASQMRLPEAFGAVLRSKQMVIVGDPKQLPPTNFFEQALDDVDQEEEDDLGSIEDGAHSILERCLQVFRTPRYLRWHYRSQHQSLIDFSNYHFYDNRLIVLPACHPASARVGVYYNYLSDAVYIDRSNRYEAEKLVDAVVAQLLQDSVSSVGIVALNQPQRDLICDIFEQKLRNVLSLKEIVDQFEARGQNVFIKNLENVQGDERDIIFISTVYGKTPGSTVVRQTFGPINGSSGWRRLNVLFTRARRRIELFSSLRSEDIVLSDKSSLGLKTLRHYLEFAQNHQLAPINPSSGEVESPFEASVADLLRRQGYEVHLQLGVQGYWIDIAVHHPERPGEFLAAIECDGATYHSSRSARDRDRIRQKLLEDLGWKGKIYRIWSTDWFTNPTKQSNRLLDFLAALRFPTPRFE